jgi:hypothetical protein
MTTRELASTVFYLREERRKLNNNIWQYETELRRRMEDLDIEALPDENYDIRLTSGGVEYDADLLRAGLGEHLTPEEINELIKEVPSSYKVSGVVANSLSRKYKGRVAAVIKEARFEKEKRLSIKGKL